MMNSNQKNLYTVRYLLSRSLEGTITANEMRLLDTLVIEDSDARRYYAELLHVHVSLRKLLQQDLVALDNEHESVLDAALWEELARHEQVAEAVTVDCDDCEPPLQACGPKEPPLKLARPKFSKFSMVSVAASVAAALFVVLYVHLVPLPQPVVAVLTDSINARWDESHDLLNIGDDIRAEPYRLLSGVVSLKFESGVEVVIEGPAEYQPTAANKMMLHRGKAFAHVPQTAIGFTIDTPETSVVDLGTEFGVVVDPAAGSEIHVYQGKVNLVAGLASQPKKSEILQPHQARQVDADKGTIRSAEFKQYLFAQKISSKDNRIEYGPRVSLASLLAGGDGITPGNQPSGIDPSTGQVHQTVHEELGRSGSGVYSPVAERHFIDGVFVPNGPTVVSSAGHRFERFPTTTGTFWSDITSSPIFNFTAVDDAGEFQYRQQIVATLDTSGDVNPETAKPMILMHANCGITFDLNKIRRMHEGADIAAFTARCGVTTNVLVKMQQEFWVLLDGQLLFHYLQPADDAAPRTIHIPIRDDQSYLTLAVTDGGDNTSFDWCLFENAYLELIPKGLK